MNTTIHREYIRNPSYKIVLIKDNTTDVWLFDNSEKDLVDKYYQRFISDGLSVKLFERLWQETNNV